MEHQLNLFGATSTQTKKTPSKKAPPSKLLKKSHALWSLYADGASRGNPGRAGAGIFLTKGNETIAKKGFFLGEKSNNQAEYLALLLGLFFFKKENQLENEHLTIFSDSELLIRQMKGIYKVKDPTLKLLKNCADDMIKSYNVSFNHVMREKNEVADMLANHGIDHHTKVPISFIQLLKTYNITL